MAILPRKNVVVAKILYLKRPEIWSRLIPGNVFLTSPMAESMIVVGK
jgi:hypothetical protein